MAVSYKDISLLSQKSSVDGTEKIEVSDTEYITPSQIVSGKQDEISDLSDIRSGAALGATALQTETDPTVPSWAKESSKPSYTLDEVSDGSTRKLASYLPLTGGVLSLDAISGLEIKRTNATNAFVLYEGLVNSTNTNLGWLGFQGQDKPTYRASGGTYYELYHAGNANKSDVDWACQNLTAAGYVRLSPGQNINSLYGGYSFQLLSTTSDGKNQLFYGRSSGANLPAELYGNGFTFFNSTRSQIASLDNSGNFTASGTITPGSDSRIKDSQKDITPEEGIRIMENLKPKTWIWGEKYNKELAGKSAAGLVAQEVKEILPDAVTISENGDIRDFHSLNYNTIQGYEIAAIKGLIEENKALKSEVAELKEKMNAIMEMLK